MARYIALLRGINVGGHAKLPMDDLRQVLLTMGCTDVGTYLQSGNAVLTAAENDADALALAIETQLQASFGLAVKVVVRRPAELDSVVAANPFPGGVVEPTKLHVAFLSAAVDVEGVAELDPTRFEPDQFRLGQREIYFWYPNGSGRSKLTGALFERRLGVVATARNWNTVTKLSALSSEVRGWPD